LTALYVSAAGHARPIAAVSRIAVVLKPGFERLSLSQIGAWSTEFVKQSLGVIQAQSIQPFGEPSINRRERGLGCAGRRAAVVSRDVV
jgi:hypothetical protein